MIKKLAEFTFFLLMIIVMAMTLNLAIMDSTGMSLNGADLLKYTALIAVAAAVFIRYPIALAGAAVLAFCGGSYAYYKQFFVPREILEYLKGFTDWLPQYVIGSQAFELQYALLFAILFILLVTLTLSLLVFSRKAYGLLTVLGAASFAFFWFIYVQKARLYLLCYLFAALLLYSYNVYHKKKLEWLRNDSNIDKNIAYKWILNAVIILLISVLMSQFVVLDIKPVQWSWLSQRVIQSFPFIESWRNDNFDGFSFTFGSRYGIDQAGYQTNRLGGPVSLSQRVMLTIETSTLDNLYLRGTVKDLYRGSTWGKTKKTSTAYQPEASVLLPFTKGAATYVQTVRITHQGLNTSTLFAPNMLTSVKYKNEKFSMDGDNEAFFSKRVGKKEPYTVTATVPYINVAQLIKIDTKALAPQQYRQLPDSISDRVRQLAWQITEKYDNDYDKAKAIEDYLRKNYSYTLSPSEVPKGTEFVDYFLFEGKEGYCTYFATSMAVLLRSADIPCRYVEGFLAKYDNSDVRNILGTDAHAWVEVNFGEYGWLTFEATPAYPAIAYRNQTASVTETIPEAEPNTPATPVASGDTRGRDNNLELEDEEGTGADVPAAREISWSLRISLALAGILLIRILYLAFKEGYLEWRLGKAQGKAFGVKYLQYILRYTKKINIKIEKEESLREYWKKLKAALPESYGEGDKLLSLLEKARYGCSEMDEGERRQLEAYRKTMKKNVRERLGALKAFISYYIVGL
jgi:transglutaminase-like putative cysteine protease